MPDRNDRERLNQAISDLANALQAAAPLATRQRHALGNMNEDAVSLETAIARAVKAMRHLREDGRS